MGSNEGCHKREDEMSKPQDAKTKKILICEIVALIVIIGLSWMLLLLPIIFYHLPDEVYTRKVGYNLYVTSPTDIGVKNEVLNLGLL